MKKIILMIIDVFSSRWMDRINAVISVFIKELDLSQCHSKWSFDSQIMRNYKEIIYCRMIKTTCLQWIIIRLFFTIDNRLTIRTWYNVKIKLSICCIEYQLKYDLLTIRLFLEVRFISSENLFPFNREFLARTWK